MQAPRSEIGDRTAAAFLAHVLTERARLGEVCETGGADAPERVAVVLDAPGTSIGEEYELLPESYVKPWVFPPLST